MSDEKTREQIDQERALAEHEQRVEEARVHAIWRSMERGRLAAFTAMAATLDKELGENVGPTTEEADWVLRARARVIDALAVLMLPPEDPEPRPIDRLVDGLAGAIRAIAEQPVVGQAFADAMSRASAPSRPPAPGLIDPADPDRASALNMFIHDCNDPSKVSDETIVALADFLAKIAASRKIGSFAGPENA